MTDHPIIFSAPMVKAILEDRKTQTRRIVKNRRKNPYGKIGDRLWVRENFSVIAINNGYQNEYMCDDFQSPTAVVKYFDEEKNTIELIVDREMERNDLAQAARAMNKKTAPSIHMPRWASRINLEITNVYIEKLQDISEEDAMAEGVFTEEMRPEEHDYKKNWWMCETCAGTGLYDGVGSNFGVIPDMDCFKCDTSKKKFKTLWKSINGEESWEVNPYVWSIEFKHIVESET